MRYGKPWRLFQRMMLGTIRGNGCWLLLCLCGGILCTKAVPGCELLSPLPQVVQSLNATYHVRNFTITQLRYGTQLSFSKAHH